ncbi:hypothetical protein JZ751_008642 [Albula glossodonta]|uniref:Uncharacterized protein n=1 Tax=Albula glossodonta TaxID=121402 RepID=A0A8T2P7H8_9TELE|nr:hypothetical protein JZ751_008642 [Albula glossodonta]
MYAVENLPTQFCRERPRILLLKRKVRNLYIIINRVCYRVTGSLWPCLIPYSITVTPAVTATDLVFFTDDCEALETGQSSPRYGEDRLQLLQET